MASSKTSPLFMLLGIALIAIVGYLIGRSRGKVVEKFNGGPSTCGRCGKPSPCGCATGGADAGSNSSADGLPYAARERCPPCPSCPTPDMSKWIKKSSVPPCPPLPDMSKYMLKTECPPLPDMSKYVLKSAVPKCPPCISTCSKPCKIGECPPCPRPRCPVVKCPEPKSCPACPAAQCEPCPEPNIQCKAAYEPTRPVRPMLASTASFGL